MRADTIILVLTVVLTALVIYRRVQETYDLTEEEKRKLRMGG